MRWLLVSSQHHPTHGGIGTYVSRFTEAASAAGWHVGLMTRPSEVLPLHAEAITLETEDQQPAFEQRIAGLRRIERIRPYRYALWSKAVAERLLTIPREWDVVEFVDSQAEGYAALTSARVRSRWRGTPLVMHAHTPMWVDEEVSGADPSRFGRPIYHRWERAAVGAADGLLCTSQRLAAELPSTTRPFVLPYPIALSAVPPTDRPRREEILLVGAVQPRKGVDVWARSLNQVLSERPSARAILIGPDTPTAPDGSSMAAWARSLVDPRLRSRFECRGALSHAEVTRRVAQASLVVVPSRFESFSFAAAEALDVGTPVLVAEGVGIADHVPGIPTVAVGDVDALADAQVRMLADPARSRAEAGVLRQRLHERCSPEAHIARRRAFVAGLGPAPAPNYTGTDTLDELADFLAEVEALESRSSVLS